MSAPTLAEDKKGTAQLIVDSVTTKVQVGLADSAQNIAAVLTANWDKTSTGAITSAAIPIVVVRKTPIFTDYANMPIGTVAILLNDDGTTTTPTTVKLYLKTSVGWQQVQVGGYNIIAQGQITTVNSTTQLITVSGLVSTDKVRIGVCSVGGTPRIVNTFSWSDSGVITVTMAGAAGTDHALDYTVSRLMTVSAS
jgi:hypothetical protein